VAFLLKRVQGRSEWALTGRLVITAAVTVHAHPTYTSLQLNTGLTPQLPYPSTFAQKHLHQPHLPSCCCTIKSIAVVIVAAVKLLGVHQNMANTPELKVSRSAQCAGDLGIADEPPC
jgi:hypothetical protein